MSCCSNNVTCSCANGIDGKNIWTLTTAQFTQPIVGGTVTISVSSTLQLSNQGFGIGQVVFIEGGGYYEVTAIPSLTTITVENLGYTGNAAPAVIVATGKKVSPGGLVGPSGSSGGNGTNGTTLLYNDNSPVSTIGVGTDLLHAYTVASNELSSNGDALKIKGVVTVTNGAIIPYSNKTATITIGNGGGSISHSIAWTSAKHGNLYMEALISRVSGTLLNITLKFSLQESSTLEYVKDVAYFSPTVLSDVTANSFDIEVFGTCVSGADTLTSQYLTVEKLVI